MRITASDIQIFMGICFFMSLLKLSYTRNYWSSRFRVSQAADVMTVNRFEEIKRYLHFNDNLVVPSSAHKLRKIMRGSAIKVFVRTHGRALECR